MDGNTLNELVKKDTSFRNGQYSKVFEMECPLEMKIDEPGILELVKQPLSTNYLDHSEQKKLIKIMVKGKEPLDSGRNSGHSSNKTPSGFAADADPDSVRIELMSEFDFFF